MKLTLELIDQKLNIDKYNFTATQFARPLEKILDYFRGEFAWYACGCRDVKLISEYSPFWKKIQNPDGTANSNYGDLVFYRKANQHRSTSYEWAKQAILMDRDTRESIIIYPDREFFFTGNKDFTCSQYQHFMIRDNKLICIVGLRSSDAIYGLTYNMPWWSIVHQYLYNDIKWLYPELELGAITVNISSAHIYQEHFELVGNMLQEKKNYFWVRLIKNFPLGMGFDYYKNHMDDFIQIMEAPDA